jgi:DNA-binding NarL/FixJ family response regulator
MSKTSVLLADDHEVVRAGLRRVLDNAPNCEVAGEATNGREAVEVALNLRPDVIVLDITMPELNGLEATRQIVKDFPEAEILILTVHDTESLVREVLNAGARGYLLKSDARRFLVTAVQSLLEHKTYFCPEVSEIIFSGYLKAGTPDATEAEAESRLSPRERQVVQLLCEGAINKEAGAKLGISVATIETHRKNVMRKLGLHSFSQLVVHAMRNQIIAG